MMSALDGIIDSTDYDTCKRTAQAIIKLIQRSKVVEIQSTWYTPINARGDCHCRCKLCAMMAIIHVQLPCLPGQYYEINDFLFQMT